MAAQSATVWADIEHAYRKTPDTVASILRRHGISRTAFDSHRKRGRLEAGTSRRPTPPPRHAPSPRTARRWPPDDAQSVAFGCG